VAPPPPEFDALFAALFGELEQQHRPTLALPDAVLGPLCVACIRLWRAKPWQYADDEPPIEIRPLPPEAAVPPVPARRPRGRRLRDRSEPLLETVDQRPGRSGAVRPRLAARLAALRKALMG
jgi:hypothetical protein